MVPYCHMGKYCMFLWPAYNCMKVKATIPRLSSSLLLLRNSPPSKLSFYNYEILILQRKVTLSLCRKNSHSDQVWSFPGESVSQW